MCPNVSAIPWMLPSCLSRANTLHQQASTYAHPTPPHFRIFCEDEQSTYYCVPPSSALFCRPTMGMSNTHSRPTRAQAINTSRQCVLCAQERRVPAPRCIYRSCACIPSVLSGEGVQRDSRTKVCPNCSGALFPEACVVVAFVVCTWLTADGFARQACCFPRDVFAWPDKLFWKPSRLVCLFSKFCVLPLTPFFLGTEISIFPLGMWC